MHQAIEDGVGERGLVQVGVPLVHGQLAGDERRLLVIAVVQQFQEVALGLVGTAGPAHRINSSRWWHGYWRC